mgnify:CR=1 FL=1
MTRLMRLNEVQYAETEHQIAGLVAQGFVPVPLTSENIAEKIVEVVVASADPSNKEKPVKGKKEGATASEGDERH